MTPPAPLDHFQAPPETAAPLVALGEHGSLLTASQQVALTQPGASKALQEIETTPRSSISVSFLLRLDKLSKLGEDITKTLEVVPRQWKVIRTVREKFSCRECEKITQLPALFHVTPRGRTRRFLPTPAVVQPFEVQKPMP